MEQNPGHEQRQMLADWQQLRRDIYKVQKEQPGKNE
jgi:hypothetical protein